LNRHRGFKILAPVVFCKKGQYWAALTFEIPELLIKTAGIIGVDMGLRILAATSEGKLIRGKKLNRLRRKTRFLKAVLQRKGTKSAKRHLRRISQLEKRQSRDVIHCAVNEVLNSSASVIAVEDLDLRARKYRKSANRRRFSVPISEFFRVLEYKAKLRGKQVVKVKPAYTSQDDCRGLSPGKRIGGRYIGVDGKVLHSDINAACNIAIKSKTTLRLNNPVSLYYEINRQVAVNPPIVGFSSLQASMALA
jgi:IS605 OrfB family transposase